jgi:hypothetical protein
VKTILSIVTSILICTAAWGYLYLEDFQSYSGGQDIASSPNWTNLYPDPPSYSEIRCADLGGGVKIGVFYFDPEGGHGDWIYRWDASDYALNYGVSVDFGYTAGAEYAPDLDLCIRCSGINGETYYLGIRPADDPPEVTLGYCDQFPWGCTVIFWSKYLEPIQPGEWHNLCCYVHGEDPVNFHIYYDGDKIGSHVETYFLAPAGRVALKVHGISDPHDFYVDNIKQLEENVGVAPTSLGRIKSAFR